MTSNILIVDDAAFIREALIQICRSGGYNVIGEASNGDEAVLKAGMLRPDIIIMDMVMPNKNGVEALREILELYPETKIIACSSVDQEFLLEKAIRAGAHCFLAKPFKKMEVLNLLNELRSPRSRLGGSHV